MGEFRERLEKIMDHYGVTRYRMAIEIGSTGANLGHLASGKFNPSFEFLQKVLARYPEINANWMINGEGAMFNDPEIQPQSHKVPDPDVLESKNAVIAAQTKTIEMLEQKVRELSKSLREYELASGMVKRAAVRKDRKSKAG